MDSNEELINTRAMSSSSPPFFLSSDHSTTWSYPSQFSQSSQSSSGVSPPSPPPHHHDQSLPYPPYVTRPCGACKSLRRRCAPRCVLAPYFPPDQPFKFMAVHKVFGACNIIKFLQEIPDIQKADAVDCLVYEAVARIKDPVHGCAGEVCRLQKLVRELQVQLDTAQAQLLITPYQKENLICKEMMEEAQQQQQPPLQDEDFMLGTPNFQIYDCFSCDNSSFPSNTTN
ncbi:LOB domain-containing protein 1-like [Macadamia integrifolia]|uniref:LOB domain-containing protein 1-like n=1 Tax=Macadamia integrifolia TaxID=60698 RepID=UPI001C4E5563|nr:LOB domain-containing protein 1-like [Macadamia integrifolia]